MSEPTGVDGQAVVQRLAVSAGALMADNAVKDVQIEKLQQRVAELEAAAKAPTAK